MNALAPNLKKVVSIRIGDGSLFIFERRQKNMIVRWDGDPVAAG
jgi:hypothetical protein